MEASLLNEISFPRIYVERTLAIIKPDAIDKSEEIEDIILTSGFTILQKRKLQLSPEQCSDFYTEHHGKLTFPKLTAYMSSGPIIALTLARDNAIAHWKAIIGPIKATESHQESLRAKYATSELENALHGSESFHVAEREIKFMFPNSKKYTHCCLNEMQKGILYTFCVALTVPTREETEEYLSRSGLPSGSSRTIQTSLKYVTELLWKEQSDIRGLGGSKYGIKSGILTKALSVQVTDPLFIERDLGYPAFVFEIHHPII
ncbi:nucleoside diphosphate kinase homolog 5-like isoform X4 [Syngnathoides biaculeatus]|uniref:nucleoside diphosphate kinase homolog 5-like isoform X4 n=1 Tax=Syngnathoides biaculeatus TaxID=300417 RepID=UPI002ADE8380|nr:nucleoside diphosphate kinase homolog 5-like isoform X4 [Syngnathoides biaculeatus]